MLFVALAGLVCAEAGLVRRHEASARPVKRRDTVEIIGPSVSGEEGAWTGQNGVVLAGPSEYGLYTVKLLANATSRNLIGDKRIFEASSLKFVEDADARYARTYEGKEPQPGDFDWLWENALYDCEDESCPKKTAAACIKQGYPHDTGVPEGWCEKQTVEQCPKSLCRIVRPSKNCRDGTCPGVQACQQTSRCDAEEAKKRTTDLLQLLSGFDMQALGTRKGASSKYRNQYDLAEADKVAACGKCKYAPNVFPPLPVTVRDNVGTFEETDYTSLCCYSQTMGGGELRYDKEGLVPEFGWAGSGACRISCGGGKCPQTLQCGMFNDADGNSLKGRPNTIYDGEVEPAMCSTETPECAAVPGWWKPQEWYEDQVEVLELAQRGKELFEQGKAKLQAKAVDAWATLREGAADLQARAKEALGR